MPCYISNVRLSIDLLFRDPDCTYTLKDVQRKNGAACQTRTSVNLSPVARRVTLI